MSKTLDQITVRDLLIDRLAADPITASLAQALDSQVQAVVAGIQVVIILARLDELSEAVVDLLAWQFHVDGYDKATSLTAKRDMVRHAIELHLYKGTPWAVETALTSAGYPSEVVEWYEYGGDPGKFMVETDRAGTEITESDWDTITALAEDWKNKRSHLDAVRVSVSQNSPLYVQPVLLAGEVVEVRPLTT